MAGLLDLRLHQDDTWSLLDGQGDDHKKQQAHSKMHLAVPERSGKGLSSGDKDPFRFRSSKDGDAQRQRQGRQHVLLGCSSVLGRLVLRTQGMHGEGVDTILASCTRTGPDTGTCGRMEDSIRQGESWRHAWDHAQRCMVTQRGRYQWPLRASLGVTFHLYRRACNASNYEKN